MNRWVRLFAIIILFSTITLSAFTPVHAAVSSTPMTVGASSLYVRSAPSGSAHILGFFNRGTHVTAYNSKYGWTYVKSGHLIGWVSGMYLIKSANAVKPLQAVVTVNGLRLRKTPSLNASIIQTLSKGVKVTVASKQPGWVNIKTQSGRNGWVSSSYVKTTAASVKPVSQPAQKASSKPTDWITVLYNGVNLRSGPSTSYMVVGSVSNGDTYQMIGSSNNWIHILLPNHSSAWIAGWLVGKGKQPAISSGPSQHGKLNGRTIVIDPGHGGYDVGAIGITGIFEKNAVLSAATILASDLRQAGANVIMTRDSDAFLSLSQRVDVSVAHPTDAFISLHYNSSIPSAVGTMTFYYSKSKDLPLANDIQSHLIQATGALNDGVRFGDFHVLRENPKRSILVELGFITNYSEELRVTSASFQQQAAQGIVAGLEDYFN